MNNVCSVERLGLQLIIENSSSSNLLHAGVASRKQSHTSKNWYSAGSCLIVLPLTAHHRAIIPIEILHSANRGYEIQNVMQPDNLFDGAGTVMWIPGNFNG